MLALYRKRLAQDEEGFTLIELMVVVLIIAILLAIAIPTFLGARQRAQDRAAQSDVRNSLAAEKVFYTDGERYTTDTAALKSIEPSISFVSGAGSATQVGVAASADGQALCLAKISKSGKTFALLDIATGATAGTYYDDVACPAPSATVPTGFSASGW